MIHLDSGEYGVLLKNFMESTAYFKPSSDLGKKGQQVINILEKSNTAKPTGGSASSTSCSCSSCKGEKVHELLRMFGLERT